jgi:SAM-dependent methyltransferase
MKCRHCATELNHTFIDLGVPPPSNSFLRTLASSESEKCYPLRVLVCDCCWLVQTEDFVGAEEVFSTDYAYFSSFSTSWLEHASNYVDTVTSRFNLSCDSLVVEIAANDGYLLQYVKRKGIPCYGIEPTHSTATVAKEKGIEIIEEFFSVQMAEKLLIAGRQADLIIANNVLAHVPDINDFVGGVVKLLKPDGVATFEFPHLIQLIKGNQFDTIYHEHYSYLSLNSVLTIFENRGLTIFDIDEIPTHGGSLRIYAKRTDSPSHVVNEIVVNLKEAEVQAGIRSLEFYDGFQVKAEKIKVDFLLFLEQAKKQGKKVVAYGAAAKASTLLNFAGVNQGLLPYVVDRNPAKLGKFMPGSLIPIKGEEQLKSDQPDFVIIFPWNLKSELMEQLEYVREWNAKFVTFVPTLTIV